MTHEPDHELDRDEQRLTQILRAVETDAPAPDVELLQSLRQRAVDAFAQAATSPQAVDIAAPTADGVVSISTQATSTPATSTPAPSDLSKRRTSMFTLAVRGILAISASVALFAAWVNPLAPRSVSGAVPFSTVLEELRGASTLHLQLAKSGQTSEILVRAPGLVRKQESPQRYQIAAGSRLWKVDEVENTVAESDSPWFVSPDRQIDLLGLLEVGVTDAAPLLIARPYQRTTYNGRDCFAYQVDLPGERGRIHIDAFADAVSNQLVGIIAREVQAPIDARPPLAELRLVALNPPVADDKFVVAKSLTEDGRIGKISDAQGIVVLRPMLARRWTPVCRETLLRPGDWLRTELRGANAVKVTLSSEVELTLGPGTLIECISPTQARLHGGQIQVKSAPGLKPAELDVKPASADPPPEKLPAKSSSAFTLLAPKEGTRVFQPGGKQLVRVDRDEKLVDVLQTPNWLAGFEGTTNNESLGSLIVNLPDGRNEPLTVGYHKVSVEIRDQIARTTIEESFVNHTPARLEGVFHFPLPQDASISGFGMWIGNDLVEADVVEKQRAREIFETILREKRDPGLLEWMGGNIFKARVFPIEGHSEKRIKIVYTQVLPLRANRYRYSYGLRSELLRTKPLRELSLSVTVNSELPLKSVTCPTHSVRALATEHSAQVDFAAQEYIPTRDFEVVCEVDGKQTDVVMIPHRRGSDGYFLVQLTPPVADGNWQRELLPDGKPLKLVLLCDTSSSMDQEKRRQQAEFVGTVLTSLGDDDRFQLACADVGTAWVAAEPMSASVENIAKARAFLENRISLGWTNLDRAFADVIQKSPADAQVIYIGDGIVSAGTTDPAAFVQRLRQLVGAAQEPAAARDAAENARTAAGVRRTFHSVTVGNTHETVVLKGIAAAGGGSARTIGGEQSPQIVALELLNEITQPGLRELKVEFRGLKVAAVYPSELPNVAAGTQQILVGRYLPEGADQSGEIVVTGLRGTEKVKYVARVDLKDAEDGNSFIPRLWARGHLDHLLAQGQGTQTRDEIIGLSEEFHIMTPYTSLLVLESDADRERFGVKRRYEMRDGEQFFAAGRANANFELMQAQMKRAGNWRQGLRRQILASLKGLGRDPRSLQQQLQWIHGDGSYPARFGRGGIVFNSSGYTRSGGGGGMGRGLMGGIGGDGFADEYAMSLVSAFDGEMDFQFDEVSGTLAGDKLERMSAIYDRIDEKSTLSFGQSDLDGEELDADLKSLSDMPMEPENLSDLAVDDGRFESKRKMDAWKAAELPFYEIGAPFLPAGKPSRGRWSGANFAYDPTPNYTAWLNTLFPALARRPVPSEPPALPETWSAEAIELSKSLLRAESLKTFEGGIELRRVADHFDPRWNRRVSRDSDLVLYSSAGWVTRSLNRNVQTIVNYCIPQQRGVYSLSFLLGRHRPADERDLEPKIVGLHDGSLSPFHEQFRDRIAHVEPAGENRVKLILTTREIKQSEIFWIDTQRRVVVKHEWLDDGVVTATVTSDDFIEIAGSWWPRKSIQLDKEGLKTSETTYEIRALARPEFGQRMDAELAAMPTVQFISLPFVKLSVARQKVADGTATFDARLAMILHHALFQQWDDVLKNAEAAEKQAVDKPGLRWLRTLLLATMRRNEQARDRLLAEVRNLVAEPRQDELFLTEFILGQAYGLASWPEFLELVELAKPVYERQPAELNAMLQWTERLAQCQEGIGNQEKSLELRRALAESSPWHVHWQTDYALRLSIDGQFDAAHAWLRKEIDRDIKRPDSEDESLRSAVANMYRNQGRWADLLKFTTEWIERPSQSLSHNSAYAQHLSALVFNDQLDQANALAQRWMDESRGEGAPSEVRRARLESALNFALGNAYNLSIQRMDDRWYQPLGELARVFVDHPQRSYVASRIMSHHYFQQSDVADRLRGELFVLLQSDAGTLSPGVLQTLVNWTLSGRMELPVPIGGRKQLVASEISDEAWQKIAATLHVRWKQVHDTSDRHTLSEILHSIYANRFPKDMLLPFLRERVATAHPDFRSRYLASLFDALLTTEWTAPIEQEAFDRLRDLSDSKVPFERLSVQIPALHRLVDAMIANRQAAADRVLSDPGGLDTLTRKELNTKKNELQRIGRAELSARLAVEAARAEGPLSNWMKIEQAWIDVQLGQNLPEVTEFCWKILGEVPAELAADDAESDDDVVAIVEPTDRTVDPEQGMRAIHAIVKQRALTTLMNLAVRRTSRPEDVARILKYIDAGIELGRAAARKPDATRPGNVDTPQDADAEQAVQRDTSAVWRNTKFRMLVALDRPGELDRELRQWIRDDVSTAPWRQSLARLLAERGKLDEAIQLLEACDKDKLLNARDYHLLADWYLVVDRRADYERRRIESFKALSEGQLNQEIYRISNRWQQTDNPPTELDENTVFTFKAIFEKSASPENYLWQLRYVFAGSRDFRMLQMLPDAVLGRSPQQIYSLLQHMNSTILQEVRNEAVADEILARIRTVRAGERTATDHRALDLLEALVERKSSELLNQPGPHIDTCLAALQRAFKREWGDGEPQMMSSFLRQLGQLPGKLAEEQLREMAALQKLPPARSRAHLMITNDFCNLIAGSYGRRDEAIREMEIEVRDYALANHGNWPHTDNGVLDSYVSFYEQAGQFAAGEGVLLRFLSRPEHEEQRKWLHDRLLRVYIQALEHNGAVSLGSGRAELFGPLHKLILQQIDQSVDENARYNQVTRAISMFDVARRHGIPDAAEEMRKFAFDVMPVILKRQTSLYRNTVTAPIQLIGDLIGPEVALRYVVEQIERYPQRLEMSWENSWQTLGYELARCRTAAGASKLEPRVLALAIRELQRELRTGESRNHHIYHQGYEHFWKEKTDEFARAAEAVLAEFKTSGRRTLAVAQYLWSGLPRQDRAIEILFIAHRQGILDEGAQVDLVNWLLQKQRFAESIPMLEALIAAHTDSIQFRTQLMTAYFRSKRPRQLTDLIQQTHEHFHENGRWTEANAAALGRGCVECQHSESAVQYLSEAIALHQRANPGSGLNNAILANYYASLASANSQLGRTREAVDAASAAIVCWGPTRRERDDHLRTLDAVLSAATDLDEYVLHLNNQSAMTGQDSPILRKAIGLVYQQRQDHPKAIAQLKLAVELQPHDAQTHRALIVSYDASGKPVEATKQLLALIDLNRSDRGLYQELAGRLKDNEAEAERAATSIIEASPGEAENHAAMAELRQTQNRWDEAIPHWEQVAELRKLEPDGLLKLGEAQLHEKRWKAVRGTVEKLRKTQWPARFNNVQNQANQLETRIPKE